jgi:hypothetical protein
MSWLLFMDESGHDHRTMWYEVHGGIAIHASRLWPFVQGIRALEASAFGGSLQQFGRREFKGCKLLDKDKFKWANQSAPMQDGERRRHALAFLARTAGGQKPTRDQFTAYGQACLAMAGGLFELLRSNRAVLFAGAIPRGVRPPADYNSTEILRRDHVRLFERFFYFLEGEKDHGLLVVDETEKSHDRKWVRRLEKYFTYNQNGRLRTQWVVPTPLFVSSEMAEPIQAADVCIYCVNCAFRLPKSGMNAPVWQDIADNFCPWLFQLQFSGDCYKDGQVYHEYGVFYVPDPYAP